MLCLWVGGGHQSAKFTRKQEVEASGGQWCLAVLGNHGNSHLEINSKSQHTLRSVSSL